MKKHILFCFQWLTIGLISAYDLYLALKYRNFMYEGELNPVSREIMALDNWDLSVFAGFKMAGTILALGILALAYNLKIKIAQPVIWALFIFQIILLFILHS